MQNPRDYHHREDRASLNNLNVKWVSSYASFDFREKFDANLHPFEGISNTSGIGIINAYYVSNGYQTSFILVVSRDRKRGGSRKFSKRQTK